MMKKITNFIGMLFSIVAMTMFIACGDDDPKIKKEEGLSVADGFYFAKTGEDPAATAQLKAASLDAPDFGAMSREGFVQTYAFLTSGSYNLVEVVGKEITTTYGGALVNVTGELVHNKECNEANSGYALIAAEVDGSAFSVASDGLYVLAYDAQSSEIIFDKIESAGIIGGATPGGWGEDTQMSGSVTADGGSWSVAEVTLDKNQMKFRFNCRWAIDRRIDKNLPFDNANGYSFFTNFGGSLANLLPGNEGPNIEIAERANYKVTMTWDPVTGFAATTERVGDAEPLPEFPEELYMIGDAVGGWDWAANGIKMIPVHSNAHLFWRIVWMEGSKGFKFAPQADWIGDFGSTGDPITSDDSFIYSKGGDNVPSWEESGYVMVVVNLDKETIEMSAPMVYGIGDAFGGWDAATAGFLFTVDNANGVIKSPSFAAAGDLRIHVTASTLSKFESTDAVDWWQAEFVVLDGKIEYRGTGDDQARNAVTAGQTVSLNFKDGTGTIQ